MKKLICILTLLVLLGGCAVKTEKDDLKKPLITGGFSFWAVTEKNGVKIKSRAEITADGALKLSFTEPQSMAKTAVTVFDGMCEFKTDTNSFSLPKKALPADFTANLLWGAVSATASEPVKENGFLKYSYICNGAACTLYTDIESGIPVEIRSDSGVTVTCTP